MSKESNPADGENWAQRTGRGRAVGKGSAPGRAEHGAGAPGASGGRPGAVCALLTPHHATARPPEVQPRPEGHTAPWYSCRKLKGRRLGAERPASREARSGLTVARTKDAGIRTLAGRLRSLTGGPLSPEA